MHSKMEKKLKSHSKTRQKCQSPLLKITGAISGVVTPKPKDKAKAIPSPLTKRFI